MKKILCLVLALVICIGMTSTVLASIAPITDNTVIDNVAEAKVYSNATIEDDFADDCVLVVLSNSASLEFKTFSSDAFSEIDCTDVEDLSWYSGTQVKPQVEKLAQIATASTYALANVDITEIETYNQVLSLEIAEPGKQNVLDAIDALMSRDDVIYAGPDYIYSVNAVDPGLLNGNTEVENLIDLPEAWELTTGSSTVWVGVIDTGIDAAHPDLVHAVDVSRSGEFMNQTRVLGVSSDTYGHGTHVAGIIAAARNSVQRTGGVCPNVKLISLKYATGGNGRSSAVQRAIEYAGEIGIDILNFSGGWLAGASNYDAALFTTINSFPACLFAQQEMVEVIMTKFLSIPATIMILII